MAKTITTIQGDTWDTIAKRVYGSELRAQDLMEDRENIRLLDTQVFPAGVTIHTPDVQEKNALDDLPDWRK